MVQDATIDGGTKGLTQQWFVSHGGSQTTWNLGQERLNQAPNFVLPRQMVNRKKATLEEINEENLSLRSIVNTGLGKPMLHENELIGSSSETAKANYTKMGADRQSMELMQPL